MPNDLTGELKMSNSINMLLDVKLPVSVQLGQSSMTVRELLKMKKGKIVELKRMAGEPIDLFIKGVLVAKGEITVLDENLSVRVSSIFDETEKFKSL